MVHSEKSSNSSHMDYHMQMDSRARGHQAWWPGTDHVGLMLLTKGFHFIVVSVMFTLMS